ncbi:hypothetical protein ASD97_14090 [Streptomyces sp. Root63]|uniref:hypothetical protein n=1 Tax=unclassified Streptomyces TaxID=2593676 RepID=UPI0006F9CE19|nr:MULTISPECIES: hypothetical protein [unclassified Streptomyces]KQX30940.1 hypothetical protein ASD29_19260 [Streptomyces sp. Root1295]KRA40878.1 hypothetical protein ASD97_14090 [Streptomyces sp. Root63]
MANAASVSAGRHDGAKLAGRGASSCSRTAEAIEEEANAFTPGIGPYSDFEADRTGEALKLLTQRVEDRRHEQRCRRQQLDQPADQATPSSQPPAA